MKHSCVADLFRKTMRGMMVAAFLLAGAAQAGAQYTIKVAEKADTAYTRHIRSFAAAYNVHNGLKTIYINDEVTTFISTGDDIKLMDLSLPGNVVVGNQPGENIARIKPVRRGMHGEDMGVLSIVSERSLIQFNLRYVDDPLMATARYQCMPDDGVSYLNPAVDMPRKEMYEYGWRIMNSRNRFYNVSNTHNRMKFRLNNIYTEGNYFFVDVTLLNRSNIKFDIEEIRVKLCDKRKVKNTNNQEIEIIPTMMINTDKSFKREYRNVIVLPKMTFPDEKVLTITVAEKQISGRTISLNIDYADVLHADSFTGSY